MLRTIVLHGALAERFPMGPFNLDVASPAEAIRALMWQLRGFREHLRQGHYRVIRKRNGFERDLDEQTVAMRLGTAKELHFVPVVTGAGGRGGLGKAIAGVALVGLAIAAPYAAPGLFGAGGALAGTIGGVSILGAATSIGASLALGGIAQMLATSPQLQGGNAAVDQRASFLFGGQLNVNTQGGPVPPVYGRYCVGSVLISAGMSIEQLGSESEYLTPEQFAVRALHAGKM